MQVLPGTVIAALLLICASSVSTARDKLERGINARIPLYYDIARDATGVGLYVTNRLGVNDQRGLILRFDNASFGAGARVDVVQVEWDEVDQLLGCVIEIRRPSGPVEHQLWRGFNVPPGPLPAPVLSAKLTPELVSLGDTLQIVSILPKESWNILVLARGRTRDVFMKVDLSRATAKLTEKQSVPNVAEWWVDQRGAPNVRVIKRGTTYVYEARYGDNSWKPTLERPAEKSVSDPRPIRMLRATKNPRRFLVAAKGPGAERFAIFYYDIYKGLEQVPIFSPLDTDATFARVGQYDEQAITSYCAGLERRKCFVAPDAYTANRAWQEMLKTSGFNLKTMELVDATDDGHAFLLRAPAGGGKWNYFTFNQNSELRIRPFPPAAK